METLVPQGKSQPFPYGTLRERGSQKSKVKSFVYQGFCKF
ncbi:hypothetical protein COO91_00672 [Nostoc flagelliforme CCNUN1]|uniref:Uncharacterized protein n=1 Tax=Nostoc flagelliforme CCNUN1 TaxID=2038116 RepID=A0A2K8SH92_9NOSO|nr:hypothetical protein COO91_00672 [Nostoc flagelliforme CCNUN1]